MGEGSGGGKGPWRERGGWRWVEGRAGGGGGLWEEGPGLAPSAGPGHQAISGGGGGRCFQELHPHWPGSRSGGWDPHQYVQTTNAPAVGGPEPFVKVGEKALTVTKGLGTCEANASHAHPAYSLWKAPLLI